MTGKPAIEMSAAQRASRIWRDLAENLVALREDAGLSRAEVARAARLHPSSITRIETGAFEPDLATLCRLSAVLGCDVSIRLFPAGAPLRDRFQAPMLEALLATAHPAWLRSLEVPVVGTVAGVIDCVLGHPIRRLVVATEVQSEVRSAEATLRRSSDKAEALRRAPASTLAPVMPRALTAAGPVGQAWTRPDVSRLLVLRSTAANRAVLRDLGRTFAAAYSARTTDAVAALRDPAVAWPGPAIVWIHLHGRRATLMDGPPRTIIVGR